jgi:hypothetical protein
LCRGGTAKEIRQAGGKRAVDHAHDGDAGSSGTVSPVSILSVADPRSIPQVKIGRPPEWPRQRS